MYVTIFQRWCIFVIALYIYLGTSFSFCYHCKLFVFMFFLFLRLEHPAGWICARYKSLLLLLLLTFVALLNILGWPNLSWFPYHWCLTNKRKLNKRVGVPNWTQSKVGEETHGLVYFLKGGGYIFKSVICEGQGTCIKGQGVTYK